MARPRLTAVVRRGLQKIVNAAHSTQPVVVDNDVQRASAYAEEVCSHWHAFARKKPPKEKAGAGFVWKLTPNGWVKIRKKKKPSKTQRVTIINRSDDD